MAQCSFMTTPKQLKDTIGHSNADISDKSKEKEQGSKSTPATLKSSTREYYSNTASTHPINLAGNVTGDDGLVYTDELLRFHEHLWARSDEDVWRILSALQDEPIERGMWKVLVRRLMVCVGGIEAEGEQLDVEAIYAEPLYEDGMNSDQDEGAPIGLGDDSKYRGNQMGAEWGRPTSPLRGRKTFPEFASLRHDKREALAASNDSTFGGSSSFSLISYPSSREDLGEVEGKINMPIVANSGASASSQQSLSLDNSQERYSFEGSSPLTEPPTSTTSEQHSQPDRRIRNIRSLYEPKDILPNVTCLSRI